MSSNLTPTALILLVGSASTGKVSVIMKFEFSAGGVVYKHERTRNEKNSRKNTKNILVLVCQHSQHHGWVFPKGLIGDNPSPAKAGSGQEKKKETKEETALREVREETGITGIIIKELKPVTYWYIFKREKIRKTVYYFLMEFVSGDIKDHDYEMEAVEWLPIEEVENRLTYKSDKQVWKEAQKLLK